MNRRTAVMVGVLAIFGIALIVTLPGLISSQDGQDQATQTTTSKAEDRSSSGASSDDAAAQKKSPHFVDSSPSHRQQLAEVPPNIVINFNFDLAEGSRIAVTVDGKDVTTGDTTIDESKLALRRSLSAEAPGGTYLVKYRACWPDGSCHDGQFSFDVDKTKASSYEDMTGKPEVDIVMKGTRFVPERIRVSPGTKITWTNLDPGIDHFVNTDPHPSHTFYPKMNSRGLKQGGTFAITLDTPGEYLYHCSAHYPDGMVGRIIVEQ